ncbi:uncharacterized protein UTRI_03472 [Ustilago trichophora]|uniref:Uncharacterized protein n=1 Tax=Ustilago trichophora TaxID=86804 RepID=A0A5C3E0I9_9BASI|nr:uncharacterized protein UTRI_03472 [Ustilago trichophora]
MLMQRESQRPTTNRKVERTLEEKEVLYATQMKREQRGEGMNPIEWDSGGMRMRLPRMERNKRKEDDEEDEDDDEGATDDGCESTTCGVAVVCAKASRIVRTRRETEGGGKETRERGRERKGKERRMESGVRACVRGCV